MTDADKRILFYTSQRIVQLLKAIFWMLVSILIFLIVNNILVLETL